jgi:hypothetical protein
VHICTAAEAAGSDRSLPSAAASKQRPDSGASMAGDACFQGSLQGILQNSYWSLVQILTESIDPGHLESHCFIGGMCIPESASQNVAFHQGFSMLFCMVGKCKYVEMSKRGTFLQSTARGIVWSRIFVSANAYYCETHCISSPLSGFTYTPGTLDDRECHWACCLSNHDCPPPCNGVRMSAFCYFVTFALAE